MAPLKLLGFLMTVLHLLTANAVAKGVCIEKPIGPCLTVHGRLSIYNGNPTLRIWKIGTKRLLGVINGEDTEAPVVPAELRKAEISKALTEGSSIYADFEVCPLTEEKAGVMQYVCIDSVTNVVVRKLR